MLRGFGVMIGSCVLVLGLLRPPTLFAQAGRDGPIDLTPKKGIDEKLFLLRALEVTYAQWPQATVDPAAIRSWIKGTRLRTIRLQKRIEVLRVDEDIAKLYKESVTLLNEYEEFLVKMRAIQLGVADTRDDVTIGYDAVTRGFGAGQTVAQLGGGTPYALVAGVVVAGGSVLYDLYQRNNREQELNAAKKEQLDSWASVMNNRFLSTTTGAETVARLLARRYGWGREVGFDRSIIRSDAPGVGQQVADRPRDPFARVRAAQMTPLALGVNHADALMERARQCVEAARLVPEGEQYDPFRAEFIAVAARLANSAAYTQIFKNGVSGSAAHAGEGIALHRTYLALVPTDPGQFGKKGLAQVLSFASRYGEAVATLNSCLDHWRDNPIDAYNYACLMSLVNDNKRAGEWLAWSYSKGYTNVQHVVKDPDFANFRRAMPNEYRRLTEPRCSTKITWGVFNDDIVLVNESPFALTNVTLTVTINLKKGAAVQRTLNVGYIAPGREHSFVNVISISRSNYQSTDAFVSSDQKR